MLSSTSPKASVRETKAAEKEADLVLKSLSRAGDAAIQTTLKDICEKLKTNVPLMYHISALLHNPEWTGVLEASIAGGGGGAASSGEKPGTPRKQWKFRVNAKRFTHLDKRVCQ